MAIISADLRFFAAQYPTDDAYGGGPMSSDLVLDGVSANVFPLIGESDQNLGRVQLRKAYASVLSSNTDLLVNSSVHVLNAPTDALVDVLAFTWGDALTTRSAAAAALATFPHGASSLGGGVTRAGSNFTLTGTMPAVGDRLLLGLNSAIVGGLPLTLTAVATVASVAGAVVTLSPEPSVSTPIDRWYGVSVSAAAPRCCGNTTLTAGVSAAATTITVDRVEGFVVPQTTPYPAAPQGISSSGLSMLAGRVPMFRPGELVHIRNAGYTVSEVIQVSRVNYLAGQLEFSTGLVNAYASGSVVSSLAPLGDLQAVAGSSFSQQTWTRVFSDTLIGSPISANYNRAGYDIAVSNIGSETERWAIVFTSATDFKLIGEKLGQIATGSTAAAFLPTNPATGQPYFNIPAAGWGTGWAVGNVLRFNTTGARAPFWLMRSISPLATATTDGAVIEMRGSY